jgi:hypothetical protein
MACVTCNDSGKATVATAYGAGRVPCPFCSAPTKQPTHLAATLALCDAVEGACLPDTYPTRIAARLRVVMEVMAAVEPLDGEGRLMNANDFAAIAVLRAAYRAAVAKLEAMP